MQTNDMRCDRHLLQNHAPATFAHFDPLSARQNSPIFGAAVAGDCFNAADIHDGRTVYANEPF